MRRPAMIHEFALEASQFIPDGAGGFSEIWSELGKLWGELEAQGGREKALEEVGVSELSHRVTVRAAPVGAPSRPTPRQRLRLGGRLFRITAVHEADPAARYLTCRVTEEETV